MSELLPAVLFVDDEISILKSLQRLLQDENWDCHYVTSAAEALSFLATIPVDLIVSDVQMPEMNGLALLAKVRQLYPGTIRLFLTAFGGQENVTQALSNGDAQQIIPKPWIDQELKEIIRSALRQSVQQKRHSTQLQLLINSIPLLPTLPDNYYQVRSCISNDDVDIEKMAKIICQDVPITTALLHWANSALFGQRFQVDTVHRAIVVLGTDIVESLILSDVIDRAIAQKMPEIPGFKLRDFKKHSFSTAIISRLLIKSLFGSDAARQDRAFTCGLLHDMGKLAAAAFFSQQFSAAINLAKQRQCPLAEVEMETIGTTHAELGSYLAEWWTLPPFICNAIQWHHNPIATPIEPIIIDAVHVANLLSHQFGFAANPQNSPQKIRKQSWDKFFLSDEGVEILHVETEKTLANLL
jgi:HD-like signal output (HDOD) protein/CheY-like chemotaxis protein